MLILEPVTKACPGLRDALFLLAKARYLAGDIKAAMSTLQHVVDNLDPTLAEAHLLMAQIQLHQVIRKYQNQEWDWAWMHSKQQQKSRIKVEKLLTL